MTRDSLTLTMPDGRTVGFADYGPDDGVPALWCNGGPGNRFEAQRGADEAAQLGVRLVGIDRPGYGLSSPRPGRTIGDWVPDALAVADELGIDRFIAVGVSTGASYAMALAAMAPQRVRAALVVCGISDMRDADLRAETVAAGPHFGDMWSASDRDAAMDVARGVFGDDGTGVAAGGGGTPQLCQADLEMILNPEYLRSSMETMKHSFTFGLQGYADDRIADGRGWGDFDVSAITCPVIVLHGDADTLAIPALARHTAKIVPGAELRLMPDLGHFSVVPHAPQAIADLIARTA